MTVRSVNRIDSQISSRCRNHSRLWIDNFIAHRRAHFDQFRFRKNRHSIVRFFAVIRAIVTRGFEREGRKLFVAAFRFLQTDNVGRKTFQPCEQSILTFAERVDVPGNDLHYSSISTPGIGTMISESAKSDARRARIHSTAKGSPWTRTTFFGFTLSAKPMSDSRDACALN